MKRNFFLMAFVLCFFSFLPTAHGQSCSVLASSLNFGNYSPIATNPHDTNGNIAVRCGGIILSLFTEIQLSTGGSGTYSPRRMTSGAANLDYNLYLSALRSTVWGNGTGGSSPLTLLLTVIVLPTTTNIPVYGRIPALQAAALPGSYSDTVTVTVIY